MKQKLRAGFRSVVPESIGAILPILLIGAFFINGLYAMLDLAPTQDEGLHLAGGLSYWERGDYRIHPENGNLPQRLIALPAWIAGQRLPTEFEPRFQRGDQGWLTTAILFDTGDHGLWWLHLGRCMVLLAGCLLCWLVYVAARHLWGSAGGLFSLWMCVWSPTILAHATLATSDLIFAMTALLFLLTFCRFLNGLEIRWAILAGAAAGLAAVSKYSVIALIPVALAMLIMRLFAVPIHVDSAQAEDRSGLRRRFGRVCVGASCIGVTGWMVIWAFYGFRFSMFHPEHADGAQTLIDTASVLEWGGWSSSIVAMLLQMKVLPEAYLHGLAFTVAFSAERHAFLLGEIRFGGWRSFFPVLFLFKSTPPMLLCTIGLSSLGLSRLMNRSRWSCLGRSLVGNPLLLGVLLALFSFAMLAIFSDLNIGHRHILPVYVLVFVLCGALAAKAVASPRRKVFVPLLFAIAIVHLAVSLNNHGHYLAYFNGLIGPSTNARFVTVDSSLDWGQDLNRYSRWLGRVRSSEPEVPVYHILFTSAELSAYGIYNRVLFSFGGQNRPRDSDLPALEPGYYAISATLLMGLYNHVTSPWTSAHTEALDSLREVMAIASEGTDSLRKRLYRNLFAQSESDPNSVVERFTRLQFERLRLHLLNQDPVEFVGDSILVFRLTESDLEEARMTGFTGYPGGFR